MEFDPSDLETYTTEQMLTVISNRFDAFVFVGSQTKSKKAQDLTYCSTGPFHACLGLVETSKMLVTAGGFEE
jgi:hypothetical protein